jgi:pyruvate/2-oxoacid:ferredoxin oxidoreductase beta subunit/Pyruvate/2-oxoacid:ferredoxin oxidoreductase gamma subunit
LAKAVDKLGWRAEDIILVTDIGCVGLADRYFPCHTIHGLHGRAVALGTGIRLGLEDDSKHIVALQGDGGATIGLQHIMEGARLNLDLTVIIHNNMLYGMTGGQSSGLTPVNYRTTTEKEGPSSAGYDLPGLAHQAGAPYTSRVIGKGNITDDLAEALEIPGFSLIEVLEYCTSYGLRYNPGEKLQCILEKMGRETGSWKYERDDHYHPERRTGLSSLFDQLAGFAGKYRCSLKKPVSIVLGGSAGEGVQTAARILANAGMIAGLEVSKKGIYPVTVGSGFSTSEIILSPDRINFTGIVDPDVVIIVSDEGLQSNIEVISNMNKGLLVIDDSLTAPETGARVISGNFRGKAGKRGAALCAIAFWLRKEEIIPVDALLDASGVSKHSESMVKSIDASGNCNK